MVKARVEQLVVYCLVGLGKEVFYYRAVVVMMIFDSSVMVVVVHCMDVWGHVHDWWLVGEDVCWKHIYKSHDIFI